MPLQKQIIQIPLAGGIDTKSDPKQIPVGKLTTLENATFQTTKELKKRNGYANLNQNIDSGGSISNGVGLCTYKQELDLFDGTNLYSYNPSTTQFTKKGGVTNISLSTNPVIRNSYQQTSQDSVYHSSGIQVIAWEDSSGGVRYSVIDYQSKDTIISNALISVTGLQPKVLILGLNIVIIYFDTATNYLKYKYISSATPTLLSAEATIATNMQASDGSGGATVNYPYDAISFNNRIYISYNNNVTGVSSVYLTTGFALSSEKQVNGVGALFNVSLLSDSSNNLWVFFSDGGLVYYFILDVTLTTVVLTRTTIDTISYARNICGFISGNTATIYYEVNGYFYKPGSVTTNSPYIINNLYYTYNTYIKTNTATIAGAIGSPSIFIRSLGVASKCFSYNGNNYFLSAHDSQLQARYFLLNQQAKVVLKLSAEPNLGGGLRSRSSLTNVNQISPGVFEISYLQKDNIGETSTLNAQNQEQPTSVTLTGVMDAIIDFTSNPYSQTQDIANELHIPGGVVSSYDGSLVSEHGFNMYPENVNADYIASNLGGMSSGQYQYSAIYEWVDNYGQTHKSSPSVPVTVNVGESRSTYVSAVYGSGSTQIGSVQTQGVYTDESGRSLVLGPGIPSPTYVSSVVANTTINITSSTTSAANSVIQFVPTTTVTFNTSAGQYNTFCSQDIKYIHVYGKLAVDGPFIFTAQDTTLLMPGQTVNVYQNSAPVYLLPNTTIASISGNTVTLNNHIQTSASEIVLQVSNQFTGNTTNTSNVIDGISPSLFPFFYINQNISGPGFTPSQTMITAIDPINHTITVSDNATANQSGVTFFALFSIDKILKPGSTVIDGSAFSSGAQVTSATFGKFNYILPDGTQVVSNNKVTFNTQPIVLGSNKTSIFSNTYGGSVSIPSLRVTNKINVASPVTINLYRTQNNGTIFYRASSLTNPIYNDPTVDAITYVDNATDLSILFNDQLYTTGGEVENIAPPSSSVMAVYKNRVILIPSENPYTWWFSKQAIPNSPIEFSDVFYQNIDQKGGAITAVAQLDDKLILFKYNQIFYVAGDGPAISGASNDFSSAQFISTDSGCINPASVVQIPNGLMYQSNKGIYLLDRSLGVQYIGADVEAYNTQVVTSAKIISTNNQVRFTLNSGICLVYDYFFNQWSVFTSINAVSSCVYNGLFNYLQSSGIVSQETPNTFTDNGSFIKLKAVISWLSLAGLQGYQRIYKGLILGEYKSAHSLIVKVAYDFNPSFIQTDTIVTSSGIPYQYRLHFARQLCEAIQLSIEDSQSLPYGEGLTLSSLALEVAVKAGLNKVAAANSYG